MSKIDRPSDIDIDIDTLKVKYRQERDKRVREDHENQYLEVADEFAGYYETDPWSAPIERDAIHDEIDLAILGGGFAGLVAGARAREQGIESLRIIEMGGDFGGTWYWNRYPGVQCDIESYCYLPLLDELDYVPKEKYSYGTEIYEHCQRIGRHFGLYDSALFQTQVTSLRWDESTKRWQIRTNRGDEIGARFLMMCTGSYNRPKLPGIPGIASFEGKTFHTSRWDYRYTGGDTNGGLNKLGDKRVAIIGTGATGIQAVPFLGQYCQHLYVIQRTPSVVASRGNRPTDPEWARSLKPGWARERRKNFNAVMQGGPWEADEVDDGWTVINRRLRAKVAEGMSLEEINELREIEDYRRMQELRDRVDQIVTENTDHAELLKAWYRWNCKRPTFNDRYLDTFNRPNVTLIDVSSTKGVQRITKTGFVANDIEYAVDCIIFASGFEITTSIDRRLGITAFEGRGGRSLYDHWKDGFRTFHGFGVHGFPNLFWTGFTQVGLSANITSMFDDQARHIAWIIGESLRRSITTVEPSEEAESQWVQTIRENTYDMEAFLNECTPGYYNNEGGPARRKHIGEPYAPGIDAFNALLEAWRDQGDLEGMVIDQ
jgi:cyclohexanone monooxygenase